MHKLSVMRINAGLQAESDKRHLLVDSDDG